MQPRDCVGTHSRLVLALRVHQPGEKSKNIPYNCLHSWKGNCKKWPQKVKFYLKRCIFWFRAQKISPPEPLDLWICARSRAGEFFAVSNQKRNFSYKLRLPGDKSREDVQMLINPSFPFFSISFLSFPFLKYPAKWSENRKNNVWILYVKIMLKFINNF